MKKLGLASVLLGALLLNGCGSSDSSDSIKNKRMVIIYTNVKAGICETSAFRDLLAQNGYQDFSTRETSNNTSCATYGKTVGTECGYIPANTGNVNCVVGVNTLRSGGLPDDVSFYETSEILESALQ